MAKSVKRRYSQDARDLRRSFKVPIAETLQEIDSNSWLVGPLILRRSIGRSNTATWYDEVDNSSYTLTDAPNPPPESTSIEQHILPASFRFQEPKPLVRKVYNAGYSIATWAIGNKAFCTAKIRYPWEEVETTDDVTLKWIRGKKFNCSAPELLHFTEQDHRRISFYTRIPGVPLDDIWFDLSAEMKQYYAKAVADIIKSMAEWKSNKISGVDGRNLNVLYLGVDGETSHEDHEKQLAKYGIDCPSLHFTNLNFGPQWVIVQDKQIGLVDWDSCGYLPKEWIGTSFSILAETELLGHKDRSGYSFKDLMEYKAMVLQNLVSDGYHTRAAELWVADEKERSQLRQEAKDKSP
ncbi:hypothetical protein PVAG01_05781 [Phlyctema vagabunda]|uniref:Aminoglycoside phosphotransferase domain-containing protein n=1 Tax=Phlyctema vagabunda TaxID=108571 RepID=A0ABR4PEC5_9HELO